MLYDNSACAHACMHVITLPCVGSNKLVEWFVSGLGVMSKHAHTTWSRPLLWQGSVRIGRVESCCFIRSAFYCSQIMPYSCGYMKCHWTLLMMPLWTDSKHQVMCVIERACVCACTCTWPHTDNIRIPTALQGLINFKWSYSIICVH